MTSRKTKQERKERARARRRAGEPRMSGIQQFDEFMVDIARRHRAVSITNVEGQTGPIILMNAKDHARFMQQVEQLKP